MGIWLGASVFFSFLAAPSLLHTFEGLAGQRPDWLPLTADLTKEQGLRLFGMAVGPMFPLYFALQGVCGVGALITAWGWMTSNLDRIHRARVMLIAGAMAFVLVGVLLSGKVEELRLARDLAVDGTAHAAAQSAFTLWHLISLLVNFVVIVLVASATVLAARLPADPPVTPAKAD
jgi:hypothetical protein